VGKGAEVTILVRACGAAYLVSSAVATVISIRDDLPVNFAHWNISSGNLTRDFLIGGGTALGAPLAILIVLAVLLVMCGLSTQSGRIALILLIVASVGLIVGMLGEPVAREALEDAGAHIERTIIVIAGLVLPLAMAVYAQAAYQIHHQRAEP
jgi:hypothetical protein